jgi:hypothetical protein
MSHSELQDDNKLYQKEPEEKLSLIYFFSLQNCIKKQIS